MGTSSKICSNSSNVNSLFLSLFPSDSVIYTEASFNAIRLIASPWLHTCAVIVFIGRLERNLIERMQNDLLPKKMPTFFFFLPDSAKQMCKT